MSGTAPAVESNHSAMFPLPTVDSPSVSGISREKGFVAISGTTSPVYCRFNTRSARSVCNHAGHGVNPASTHIPVWNCLLSVRIFRSFEVTSLFPIIDCLIARDYLNLSEPLTDSEKLQGCKTCLKMKLSLISCS